MVHGPEAGLDALAAAAADPALAGHHRVAAVRAHLLELAGDAAGGAGRVPDGRPARRSARPSGATWSRAPPRTR